MSEISIGNDKRDKKKYAKIFCWFNGEEEIIQKYVMFRSLNLQGW